MEIETSNMCINNDEILYRKIQNTGQSDAVNNIIGGLVTPLNCDDRNCQCLLSLNCYKSDAQPAVPSVLELYGTEKQQT